MAFSDLDRPDGSNAVEDTMTDGGDPADMLLAMIMGDRITRMSPRRQAVYDLCCLRDYTQREAGERLGVAQNTVNRDMREIRKALRACL